MLFNQYSFFRYLAQLLLSTACAIGCPILGKIWSTYAQLGFSAAESYANVWSRMTLGALSGIGIVFALGAFFLAWISDEETTRRKKNLMLGACLPFIVNLIFLLKSL